MNNTKDVNKLLSFSGKIEIINRKKIKVKNQMLDKVRKPWKTAIYNTRLASKKAVEAVKTGVANFSDATKSETIKAKENVSNFVEQKQTDISNFVADTKVKQETFVETKKTQFNDFIGTDLSDALNERNAELQRKYDIKTDELYNIMDQVETTDLLEDEDKNIYLESGEKKIKKLEDKLIEEQSKKVGVFTLSKLFLKKLNVNAKEKREEKKKAKLAHKADLALEKAEIKQKEEARILEEANKQKFIEQKAKLEELIAKKKVLQDEMNKAYEKYSELEFSITALAEEVGNDYSSKYLNEEKETAHSLK